MQDHWEAIAWRVRAMGPPQVPAAQAIEALRSVIGTPPGLTVLLGVTPALVDMARPLVGYDLHEGMIRAAWPGDTPGRTARVGDWRALPLASETVACVIGDGSFSSVPDDETLAAVLSECRRILMPEGLVAVRLFARPENCPTLDEVFSAARAGRAETLNVLRWQIAAALARPPDWRIAVADILAAAEAALGPLAAFAAEVGLDPAQAEYFETYRGSDMHYLFTPRSGIAAAAERAGLSARFVETTGYPGAGDCPIAVLRPLP